MSIFKGSAVAIITPFTDKGVNYEVFKQLIDFQINNGTQAITVCGTTGEPSTMSKEERLAVIKFAVEYIAKRVPVIAGTGGNNTEECIALSKEAEKLGADALLVVTPYYNKCTQKGLIKHFTAIADSVKIPLILYNVPSRTGVNLLPSTCLTLSSNKNIVAVKEASGNIEQITELIRLTKGKLDIYSGDDGIILPVMALGGLGVISVIANAVPKLTQQLCEAIEKNDYQKAREIQFKLSPFVKAAFIEVNPIPIKTAVNLMGYNAGILRMPLCEMEEDNLLKLKASMKELGLIK